MLTPNLAARSAGLRRESLRLLCAFRQPLLPAAAWDLAAREDATVAGPGIVAKQPEPAAKAPRPPSGRCQHLLSWLYFHQDRHRAPELCSVIDVLPQSG